MTEELDVLKGMLNLLKEVEGAGEYATKSMADFGLAIRSGVRGFWKGVIDRPSFLYQMTRAIRRQLTNAWHEGAKRCGISPGELSSRELLRLHMIIEENIGYIPSFADAIEAGSQANGGKLSPLISRAEMWTNKYMQAQSLGQQMACLDQKLRWDLGPTKEHCFSAGTPILTRSGWIPIEEVQEGVEVWTLIGWRKVTETHKNLYLGSLYKVGGVTCTAGHPFLTSKGWVDAKTLSHGFKRHVALPDADDLETTSPEVSILGRITSLLGFLPFGKRLKSRMSVPIVAICLDDDVADLGIDSELGLDKEMRFVTHTKSVEVFKERPFQVGRIILFYSMMAFHKLRKMIIELFRMFLPIASNLGAHLRSIHRIVRSHVIASFVVNDPLFSILGQSYLELCSSTKNRAVRKIKHLGDLGCSFVRIMNANNFVPFFSPGSGRLTFPAIKTVPFTDISADDTLVKPFPFLLRPGNFQRGDVTIPANETTEPRFNFRRINDFRESITAAFTDKISGRVRTLLSACHRLLRSIDIYSNPLYHDRFIVYNIEVDEAEHYVADGLVVHNCKDCLKLNGRVYRASIWEKYDVYPQSPRLECGGFRCQCRFTPTNEPGTPGRPPRLSG